MAYQMKTNKKKNGNKKSNGNGKKLTKAQESLPKFIKDKIKKKGQV